MADEQGQRTDGSDAHLGWHSRGYLPHFDGPGIVQSVTFRLADALPAHVVERITADPAQGRSEAWPTRKRIWMPDTVRAICAGPDRAHGSGGALLL